MLSQENGCEYIVLYQILCTKTANTNGSLATKMGEMLVPYDIEKIVRDTKHFSFDTVAIAIELYKKLGLVYVEDGNVLKISNYEDMVGSETKWAKNKRIYRSKQKEKQIGHDEGQYMDNVRQEIDTRDKDIRDKDKEYKHTYTCHLKKSEKDFFCLDCQKKNVCDKPTSEGFLKVCGKTFEEFVKERNGG